MRFKYSDSELNKIMKEGFKVVIDTREKKTKHIIKWFDDNKIPYCFEKLDFGDYSAKIVPNDKLSKVFPREIYFDRDIVLERKANIDELCNNLKEEASRLKSELAHIEKYGIKSYLYIEDNLYHKHLREGKYRSGYQPKSLTARLKAIELEYNIPIVPVNKEFIASEIYLTLYHFIRNKIKKSEIIFEKGVDNLE